MPYRSGNYNFVIDSSFEPFSLQELMTPFLMYKDAYEKDQAAYDEYIQKADTFKYLEDTLKNNPDSKAAQIYKNYIDDIKKSADDLSQHGLSANNRRALTALKRRYQGEIGLLEQARTAMDKERERRAALSGKDPSMLYAENNLNLDQFLGNNTPNLYGISGNDLYARGAAIGQSLSSREYSAGEMPGSTLGGFYKIWEEAKGVPPEKLAEFINSPQVQQLVENDLIATGVAGNLTGHNLEVAKRQMLQGLYNSIKYEKSYKPYEDKAKMTPYQQAQLEQSRMSTMLSGSLYGKKWNGSQWVDDESMLNVKGRSSSGSSSSSGKAGKSSGTEHKTIGKSRLLFTWDSGNPDEDTAYSINPKVATVKDDESEHPGTMVSYDELPAYAKDMVRRRVGRGKVSYYDYYFRPYHDDFGPWNTHAQLEIVPKAIVTDDSVNYDFENDSDLDD